MADYAGAVAAIVDRLKTQWAERTPIGTANGPDPEKVDADGDLAPWIYVEVLGAGSTIVGAGKPGDQRWVYDGLISIHVFVPRDGGTDEAFALAVAAGEIFRAKEFYRQDGCCVRSWSPRVDGGGSGADDGLWWRVTATIPFEYLHRG